MADADVITVLIAVGILEPLNAAEPAKESGADGAARVAFKASDTAALRAVAVQVRCKLMRLALILRGLAAEISRTKQT